MISKRIWPVIKREIKVKLGVGFVLSTIFIPLIMAAIVGIQALLANMKSDTKADIILLLQNNASLESELRRALDPAEFVKSGLYKIHYEQRPATEFPAYLKARHDELLKDDRKSVFVLADSALTDKKVQFYSANPANNEVRTRIGVAINKALNTSFFAANDIHNVDIKFIQTDVDISGNKVSASGTQAESWGPLIVGGGLALLLMLGVSFNSLPVMNIVVSEKANRVYEILLSSLTPSDLMWGKIIGTAAIAALQMLIWVAAGIALVLLMDNFVDASATLRVDFKPLVFAYYFVNYVTGLMIFLTLYAGLSSMFDNPSVASSRMLPLYFFILLPFYTVFALLGNPASTVSQILSLAPITSLYVMPARMSLIDLPAWQPAVALAGNLALAYFANFVASKVYRISVLSTGNDPSLRQIFLWVRHA
jgi:ABC-2 type transport system permease protein